MIQNAAARLVFNEPKRTHVTPLFISLHWLPVAARIKFKTLMLAYRTTTGSAPSYFHSLLRIYIPSRSLRSASERRLVVPSQRGSKSLSRTFSFTIPGWWNNLPTLSGMLDPCQSSSNNWRLISFGTTWLHPKLVPKKKKKPFPFSPSLASLYLFEQWLRLGVTSTSSVWLPLQDESLYVLPNCKSLWIKASAKWLNVNVNVIFIMALLVDLNLFNLCGERLMSELLYHCRRILSYQAGDSEPWSTVNLSGLDVDLYLCVNLQGKFYLLIEELSQLFRALVPIQLWYKYIMGEDPSSSYFLGAMLIIIYTLCKVAYLIVSLPLMIRFFNELFV